MKDWIKAIVIDTAMLWSMAVAYLNVAVVGEMAENAISFLGILCLVVGVIWLFDYRRSAAKKVDSNSHKIKSQAYYSFRDLTAVAKIVVAASFGWYWVAAGFLIAFVARKAELAEMNKLLADKE